MHIKLNNYSEYDNYSSGSGSGSDSGFSYVYNYSNEYDSNNTATEFKFYILVAFLICFACLILPYAVEICRLIKNKCCIKLKIECMKFKSINCFKCKLKWLNIKNKIYPESNDNIDNETCTICLNENDTSSTILKCQHTFHKQCINKWIDTSIQNNTDILCPLCRDILY